MTRIKEGDFVKILPPTGKDFDDDRIGCVESVDGSYILVKRNISGVVCELYPNELRLLEGDESDMAYFTRGMWRGLRTPEENQAWLAEGYMREIDWEAAQDDNVTVTYDPHNPYDPLSLEEDYIWGGPWPVEEEGFTYDPLDTEGTEVFFPHPGREKGSHVETLPKNIMCDEEAIHRIGLILKKYMNNKNYKNAMKFIK